jgi:lysozyme family protein
VFAAVAESHMNDFKLNVLKPRYEQLFSSCQIRSSWLPQIQTIADTLVSLRTQYDGIEAQTTVPWWFIGILHYRASNFQAAHLHNGDPLTGRTVRFPEGRPIAPPANGLIYTFAESAIDALGMVKYDKAKDRSMAAWLWRFEMWDGFGSFNYARKGINSEYLWNGTNHFGSGQNQGKFTPDNQFDPYAKSDRVGAAAILWYLLYKGILGADGQQLLSTPSQTGSNGSAPVLAAVGANGSYNSPQSFNGGTTAVQTQVPIELLNVFKYYGQMPHQDAAIVWLQQQLPTALLAEFAVRWRANPNPVIPTVAPPTLHQAVAAVPVTPPSVVNAQPAPVAPAPKPDTVQLKVPYLSQLDNETNPHGTCNVTSLSMCMAYYGHPTRNAQGEQLEDELNRYCNEHGLDRHIPQHLAQVVRDHGYKDDFRDNGKWDDVKKGLQEGKPCVIHGYFTGSGHIITIVGYNQKGWIVHDPYGEWYSSGYDTSKSGANLTYSYDMMERVCGPNGTMWIHLISK